MASCISCGTSVDEAILNYFAEATLLLDTKLLRVHLEELDTQIAHVEKFLKRLVDLRSPFKKKINALDTPIINLLPSEVTAQVFTQCISTFTSSWYHTTEEAVIRTPLFLGAICSSWRNIAWSMPELWCVVNVRLSRRRLESQEQLLEEWLQRAGQLPLCIRVSCSASDLRHWEESPPVKYLATLARYSEQWHTVDINLPTSCFDGISSNAATSNLPSLTSLFVEPPGGQSNRHQKIRAFNTAPALKRVSLSGVYLSSFSIPWCNVTQLRARSFFMDESLEVLRQTPKLVHCILDGIVSGDDGYGLPSQPHLLPCVKTLELEVGRGVEMSSFFDLLTAPAMQKFVYDAGRISIPHANVQSFLTRSSCTLTSLSLLHIEIAETPLINILRLVPSVVEFSLDIEWEAATEADPPPFNDTVWHLLTPNNVASDEICLLPKLKTLRYSGPHSFSALALQDMLDSRKAAYDSAEESSEKLSIPIAQLESVSINFYSDDLHFEMDETQKIYLRNLIANGLNLEILDDRIDALASTGTTD